MGKNMIATVTDVTGATTIAEVLGKSNTDWAPQVNNAAWIGTDGLASKCDFRAVVRPDNGMALGMVKDKYRANDHRMQLGALDELIQDGTLEPKSVSLWDNGGLIAYQFLARTLDAMIGGSDRVSPLLTLSFRHDGKGSDDSFFADFRWFCKNQLGRVRELTGSTDSGRVLHFAGNVDAYAHAVRKRIAEIGGSLTSRYDTMRRMADYRIGDKLLPYIARAIGSADTAMTVNAYMNPGVADGEHKSLANTMVKVLGSYQADDCGAPDSLWRAYNAVTRHYTHHAGRTEASRMRRALVGSSTEQESFRRPYYAAVELMGAA